MTDKRWTVLRWSGRDLTTKQSSRPPIRSLPSQERLQQLFNYDSETGLFTWAIARTSAKKGAVAGFVHLMKGKPRRRVSVDGQIYNVHEIIWKFVTGKDPFDLIVHVNGNYLDHRWVNLTSKGDDRTKWCWVCHHVKPISAFRNSNNKRDGLVDECKMCGPSIHLKWKYGITKEQALQILEDQNYRCAICLKDLPYLGDNKIGGAHIDHQETPFRIRGALCHNCNLGIGHFKHNERYLQNAVGYIRKWTDTEPSE